jgi:pyruvate/2-oxoglutarate dehydrogenase complex dihydrolipoamide acyltransferase (E2) component
MTLNRLKELEIMDDNTYTIKPFPSIRKATIDLLAAASQKHMIHGLIEVDVSKPRHLLQQIKETKGESISFTGFVIYCCARAVDMNKHMQAYRDWRNRLILFDQVDVSTTVERLVDGRHQVVPTIIRGANRKTLQQIHQGIRQAQAEKVEEAGVFQTIQWYLALPAFIRRLFFRILGKAPHVMKKSGGTIMVTSVGMFGSGAGWGLPVASHTLNVTVGGIVSRPSIVNGQLENREYLCLTLSFDHDIIDGAPAARFIQRFRELIESGSGLTEEAL